MRQSSPALRQSAQLRHRHSARHAMKAPSQDILHVANLSPLRAQEGSNAAVDQTAQPCALQAA